MAQEEISMFFRLVIAVMFIVAAVGKSVSIRDFEVAIEGFQILPPSWSKNTAVLVVAAEWATVVALVVGGVLLPIGFLLAIGLLVAFSLGIASVLRRRITTTCNCFGSATRSISLYDLVRNGIAVACCGIGFWSSGGGSLSGTEVALVAVMSAGAALILVNLRDIAEALRRPL